MPSLQPPTVFKSKNFASKCPGKILLKYLNIINIKPFGFC